MPATLKRPGPLDVEALMRADREYVWHPFTQMKQWVADDDPVMIAEARGAWITDVRGRRFLDGVASLWVQVHGHSHPTINAAVAAQLERVSHSTMLGLSNVPATELAERLVDITPKALKRVFYSDNGSTATEVAVKMAFQYWRHSGHPEKTRFVRLKDAYHGDTLGAVSVGGIDAFHAAFKPLLFDTLEAPNPHAYRCPLGADAADCARVCGDALAALLDQHGHQVAALILEPLVQGAAGILTYPEEYLRHARALCDQHDVLMIVDEVATGFGRTGAMFACERAAVEPDLMALAKGLTGGYLPLAATLATEEIYEAFLGAPESSKQFFHGHTYTGNPLAAAAALASLEVFETEKTLEMLQPKIRHLRQALAPLADHPHVGDIRQCGFMVGIELVEDRGTRRSFARKRFVGERACRAARDAGVILRPLQDVIVLMPPLCVSTQEIDQIVEAARHGIEVAVA